MRLRHKPWADDFIKESNEIVNIAPQDSKGKWQQYFGNEAPIHIEIGMGKGQFIVGMANQYPNANFIGIEQAKSVIVSAIEKVKESELPNVRLLNEDAQNLREIFAENEVDKIYLNFSDPWPKNRHEKRRLTFHTFLSQYKDILKPNGELILKTDNRGLFEYSLVSFSKFGMNIEEVNLDLHAINDETNVMTEYEEKFSNKGQRIYRCRATF